MSELRKAIIISTGMDNLPLLEKLKQSELVTGESLNRIKGLYAKLAKEKAAIEEASVAKSREALAKTTAANLAEIEKIKAAQIAAAAEVSAGQKAANDASFAVLGANKERNAVRTLETSASGVGYFGAGVGALKTGEEVAKVGHEAGSFSTVLRESAVMVREGLRGNFTRMIGSFSILLGAIGSVATVALAVVGAADAVFELLGGNGIYRQVSSYFAAKKQEEQGTRDLEQKTGDVAGELRKRVAAMTRTGVLDESDSRADMDDLAHPTYDSVSRIQIETNSLLDQQKAAEKIEEHQRAIAQATKDKEESDKIIAEQMKKQADLTDSMSLEYQKMHDSANKVRTDANRVDESIPTLEDLAGRGFTNRLNRRYGAGGRFDLGRGNGVFGDAARTSELAAKQMQWDLTYGHGKYEVGADGIGHFTGDAEKDRRRKISADNLLGAAGLDTPAQKFEEMKQHLADIAKDMGNLLAKADRDGINVRIPSN